MSQLAKTIYFPDYPRAASGRSGLTVPFPDSVKDAYDAITHLSSYAIRKLIGYDSYAHLSVAAESSKTSAASFARDLMLKNMPRASAESDKRGYELALQSTFQGGKGSPLHDWYPYLEGYSPDFVNTIIDTFAPDAQTILDPFCGSGTTALIAMLRGRTGLYAEVNPVCRFVIEAKATAIRLPENTRYSLADQLERLADDIPALLKKSKPDLQLKISFGSAFGDRPFFEPGSFESVLRMRTLADRLSSEDALLGQFFTLGVLRSLVPGSLLIRRGDLRFRTDAELFRIRPDVVAELTDSLRRFASDLHDAPHATGSIEHVADDARALAKAIQKPVDAVITSPPYLNGTNYFRNTKIELWFIRQLATKAHLRNFRNAAITAGINDVTVSKVNAGITNDMPRSLQDVLKSFQGNTYDMRIPLMVRAYFEEMNGVVKNLKSVVAPGGTVAIDLGDSCYGSVWVPTDRILAEQMELSGFEPVDRVILRERQSRDGRKLIQSLQVFRHGKRSENKKPNPSVPLVSASASQLAGWEKFKNQLPHQQGEMAKRNWGHGLHSLCSYQGKLKPSIAHSLVECLLPKAGGRVLDPFSGVGTIPFEAQLLGHTAYGFDISPAAIAISRAKIEPVDPERVAETLLDLRDVVSDASEGSVDLTTLEKIRFNGPLPSYFHPRTLAEIVAVRDYFRDMPPDDGASALVFSAMLHILHGNRPYALSRRSHPITPFAPTGPAEYRSLIERLQDKVERSLLSISNDPIRRGRSYAQDATLAWPDEVSNLDAIITSPPFFDSTRFHTANWMRLWFAGWDAADFQSKPGSFVDERQKASFDIYRPIFQQSAERLKKGGFVLIHLGKSAKCDMAVALEKVAADYLEVVNAFTESVEHCESHGIRDKGTVTHHQYLLLRRS